MATKYPEIARNFFAKKGVHVDMIKLYGSMELAPLTGMADAIVDLVSTGNTLKANDLVEVEPIMDISSRWSSTRLRSSSSRLRCATSSMRLRRPLPPRTTDFPHW
jgi:ATP phosphoribosyltransferase